MAVGDCAKLLVQQAGISLGTLWSRPSTVSLYLPLDSRRVQEWWFVRLRALISFQDGIVLGTGGRGDTQWSRRAATLACQCMLAGGFWLGSNTEGSSVEGRGLVRRRCLVRCSLLCAPL